MSKKEELKKYEDQVDKEEEKLIYSNTRSLGGQQTNGPNYLVKVTHPEIGIEIIVDEFRDREKNKKTATWLARLAIGFFLLDKS